MSYLQESLGLGCESLSRPCGRSTAASAVKFMSRNKAVSKTLVHIHNSSMVGKVALHEYKNMQVVLRVNICEDGPCF